MPARAARASAALSSYARKVLFSSVLSFALGALWALRGLVSRQRWLVVSQRCEECDARLSPTIDAAFLDNLYEQPIVEQRQRRPRE